MTLEQKPLLVSGSEARRLLGIGCTKYFELVKDGVLETVVVGKRRQVRFASIERIATGAQAEAA